MSKWNNILILSLSISFNSWIKAQIAVPEDLVAGKPVNIQLEENLEDTLLTVTYRPNSNIAEKEFLRSPEPVGSFSWTPKREGVVSIAASSGSSINVSVGFQSFSYSGLMVMILAGFILFGGATFAFRVLFKIEDGKEIITERPPDT